MDDTNKVVDLLVRMMAIDSTSGKEGLVGDFMAEWFESKGYFVTKQKIGSRCNLLATPSPWKQGEDGPPLIINSHMDTVPPFIPPTVDKSNGVVKGRGSCDAKGVFATMIYSVLGLPKALRAQIGFLWVVDEECGYGGSTKSIELGLGPQWIICGEPTECKLVSSQKGNLSITVEATGKAGHSGYPNSGVSAIDALLKVLGTITSAELPPVHPVFGETTINIGTIQGGMAANVIPAKASAEVLYRLNCEPDVIWKFLKSLETDCVKIKLIAEASPTKLATVPGFDTIPVAFGTDIPNLMKFKSRPKPLLYGPGTILVAHTEREEIAFADIEKALHDYKQIITYCLSDS